MKIEVDKDKLKKVCDDFGLDINKALYYTNVVVIPGSKDDLYVTLDKNCNVIDVREYDDRFGGMYNYFEGIHTCFNDDIISDIMLEDFDSAISMGTVIKIADKYSEYYGGNINSEFNEDQKNFVSYCVFLRQVMNRFLLYSYHMKSLGYSCPDLNEYMNSVVSGIKYYVDRCLAEGIKPDYKFFVGLGRGQNVSFGEGKHLDDAFKLLIKFNNNSLRDTSIENVICKMKDSVQNEPIQKKKIR